MSTLQERYEQIERDYENDVAIRRWAADQRRLAARRDAYQNEFCDCRHIRGIHASNGCRGCSCESFDLEPPPKEQP